MKSKILIYGLLLLVFTACNKTDSNKVVGPRICPSEGFNKADLTLNNVSNNYSVNFVTQDSINFDANFAGEKVNWTISIVGRTSGAKTTMNGYSAIIDTAWYGLSSNGYAYTAEVCDITYQIACLDPVMKVCTISNPTDYNNIWYFKLLTDFDGKGKFPSTNCQGSNSNISQYNGPSDWSWYGNTAADEVTYEFDFYVPQITAAIATDSVSSSPAGGKYLRLVADRNVASLPKTYFFGGVYNDMDYVTATGWSSDPKAYDVYINMWVKSISAASNSQLQLGISSYSCQCSISKLVNTTSSWKYVSWKLSDHEIFNYSNFKSFGIALGSAPDKGMTGVGYVDHISFSRMPLGEVIKK